MLIHPGKTSSLPERPQRKGAVPRPLASLPASLHQNKGRLARLHRVDVLGTLLLTQAESAAPALPAVLRAAPCSLPDVGPLPPLPVPRLRLCVCAHCPSSPCLWPSLLSCPMRSCLQDCMQLSPPTRAGSWLPLSPSDTGLHAASDTWGPPGTPVLVYSSHHTSPVCPPVIPGSFAFVQ